MTTRNLMKWRIIRSLEPKFISKIHMVIVHGYLGCSALIVTKDGIVYALGNNESGCSGTGDTCSTLCPTEVKALSRKDIKSLACATDEVSALTEKGEIYSWGKRNSTLQEYTPTCQDFTSTVVGGNLSHTFVDVACGKFHSAALTNDGKNIYRQVNGNDSMDRCVGILGMKFVNVRCCSASTMAVTDKGEVYGWGSNTKGELGHGSYTNEIGVHKVKIPTEVVIEKIACGQSHTLALSKEGVLYVWGDNTHGQLGLGHKNMVSIPVKLEVEEMGKVLDVAATPFDDISVAMCECNQIFIWGLCLEQSLVVPRRSQFDNLHDAFAYASSYTVMHQPLIVSDEEQEMSLTDHLRQAFDDVTSSDLTICVRGKSIHVHKAILMISSSYFRTMFKEHCAETDQSVIEHEQFSYDVYRAFLKYLYTDHIDVPAENIPELLDLAITYSDRGLCDSCVELIKREMNVANVSLFYSFSIQRKLKALEDFCFKFIVNNLTAVVETPDFSKLDEFTIKSFIVKAGQASAFKT
ncbi:RCC1 and BTB domain-containing protein 1-like isoform X2 [Andrena cerasifolii]|uniref:RCC1 and BTB domain-containing protein 1-like isoform X2 n=1 Tax=Andrena cerasifolii TaxID=2819439 RepID=UPI004038389B